MRLRHASYAVSHFTITSKYTSLRPVFVVLQMEYLATEERFTKIRLMSAENIHNEMPRDGNNAKNRTYRVVLIL